MMGAPHPLVPAKAGTQNQEDWIPACAGMSGLGESASLREA
jgi:hypothetical protein